MMKYVKIAMFLLPYSVLAQVDTLKTEPYHITNPTTHSDTIYMKGYAVKDYVDSTGVAVFLYDPERGIWIFNSGLSTGLID